MYGIFAYIYHKNQPNVGKYTIHGSYGILLAKHNSCPWGLSFWRWFLNLAKLILLSERVDSLGDSEIPKTKKTPSLFGPPKKHGVRQFLMGILTLKYQP